MPFLCNEGIPQFLGKFLFGTEWQGCRCVPQKNVRKEATTDGTKLDLDVGFQGLKIFMAKSTTVNDI